MKKQILKTIITVGLICSLNLLADILPPTPEEYKEIVDSFKLVDTTYNDLSKTYKIDGDIVKGELEKQVDSEYSQYAQHIIILSDKKLSESNYWLGISVYDQKLLSVACMAPNKEKVVASLVRSSTYYKKTKERFVKYTRFVASFTKDTALGNYEISGLFDEKNTAGVQTQIPTYNPEKFYPYFNEQRILARLYETGTCDKEVTQKANIEVLVADKWIPQEQSWNIKDEISNNINSSYQTPSLTLNQLLENAKSNKEVSLENISKVLRDEPLTIKNVQKYNDIAYYLQQANANDEAIFILEKIIDKFPNRTVAYLNLGDAHAGNHANENVNEDGQAKVNYEKYINLMKQENKENKIPKRVLEFK